MVGLMFFEHYPSSPIFIVTIQIFIARSITEQPHIYSL